MKEDSGDERPPIWIGHVSMATPCVAESHRFMLKLGLRPIVNGDDFAVLELRGGTHLVLLHSGDEQKGRAPFDLMVEDIGATHERLTALGLDPSPIETGRIHRSFTVNDPSGQGVLFNSSHVSDLPV